MRLFRFIPTLLLFLAIPILILSEVGVATFYVTIPSVIIMQMVILKLFGKTQPLIIFSLYLFVYFLYLIPYFYFGFQLSYYTKYQNEHYYNKIAYLFYLFYLGVLLSYKYRIRKNGQRLLNNCTILTKRPQRIIFFGLFALVFIMSLRQGQNVIASNSGSYQLYQDNLDNINGMPFYVIMTMCFLPLILKSNLSSKITIGTFIFIFSVFCITRGLRIVLVPLAILAFLIYIEGKIKNKYLYIMIFIGYFFIILANALKMNIEMQMNLLFSEGDEDVILSHHSDMLYGAAAGIGLIEDGIVTLFQRVILNITFLLEAIVPPSIFPDEYKFPQIISSSTEMGGGCLCIISAYYMWGYLGVILMGYWFARFVCNSYRSKSSIRVLVCIMILIFFPRWVSYDFNNLIRFPFIAFLLYLLIFRSKFS